MYAGIRSLLSVSSVDKNRFLLLFLAGSSEGLGDACAVQDSRVGEEESPW